MQVPFAKDFIKNSHSDEQHQRVIIEISFKTEAFSEKNGSKG